MTYRKRWKRANREAPKDHEQIPEGLGIGIYEERDPDGQLFIYLAYQPSRYIVLGKYAGNVEAPYYVSDCTRDGPWIVEGRQGVVVSRHEHLLMALAKVQEIVEDFERSNKK